MKPRTGAALLAGVVLAAGATAFATGLVGADPRKPEDRRGTTAEVTRIAFTEQAHAPKGSPADPPVRIAMYARHAGDVVDELHFRITSAGKLVEERRWVAGSPDAIAVRNWVSCGTSQEETPPPRPDSLKVVVRELFGPPTVPEEAREAANGTKRWETSAGMITTDYTDLGGAFPDRRIQIKGPDGTVGSTIGDTEVAPADALPGWRPGWEKCAPVEQG
ncbi:hypothetical protein [Streptomyces sp. cmx-18-6]|uniref:hypothetical protein n=1 Tax=Streptomyces sp. cmx-18-6 TaxID=2790930 RepID=UPI0039811EA7